MVPFSLQLFLVKHSFRHLIFQVNKLLHKLLFFSYFLQLGYLLWISLMHLIFNFALYFLLVCRLRGLKPTGAQSVHHRLASGALPHFQLLLQCTESLAMNGLLENVRREYHTCRFSVLSQKYPSAIWETIILPFGPLFLLYSSGRKHCQHVWLSNEKGHCMKRQGRASLISKSMQKWSKARNSMGGCIRNETQTLHHHLKAPAFR